MSQRIGVDLIRRKAQLTVKVDRLPERLVISDNACNKRNQWLLARRLAKVMKALPRNPEDKLSVSIIKVVKAGYSKKSPNPEEAKASHIQLTL